MGRNLRKTKSDRNPFGHAQKKFTLDGIAEAVHESIAEATMSDGAGQCFFYATVAATVMNILASEGFLPGRYGVVLGGLYLADEGPEADGIPHSVVVHVKSAPGSTSSGISKCDMRDAIALDFSTRHYPSLLEFRKWRTWEGPPPPYLQAPLADLQCGPLRFHCQDSPYVTAADAASEQEFINACFRRTLWRLASPLIAEPPLVVRPIGPMIEALRSTR